MRDGGVTAPPWSPDSLWVELSHAPHQSTAPVVTHQGDLRDRLEKHPHRHCRSGEMGYFLAFDETVPLTLAILSKNAIRS